MNLPDRPSAHRILQEYVHDDYQRHHALMVATALEGYANAYREDADLWYITGLLHDLDFERHPATHPYESLGWFRTWDYPDDLVHAVEAHAYGYNGYATLPRTKLAAALIACDEICGIFYAYRKLNPIPYGQMKAGSIRKKLKEPSFAAKVDRNLIRLGCEHLGVSLDQHVTNLIQFLAVLN